VRDPVGVICACRPFFSCARSALPTLALTTQAFVLMTVITLLVDVLVVVLPPVAPPPPPEAAAPEPLPPEPDEPDEPTVSPMLIPTAATTPLNGAVNEAAARLSCAVASCDCAWASCASADVIWVAVPPETSATCCSAAVTAAVAVLTAEVNVVVPTVASTAPLFTVCPTVAATVVTVPLTVKLRSARCFGWIVPVVATVCDTSLVLAATRLVVVAALAGERVKAHVPTAAALATTSATATDSVHFFLNTVNTDHPRCFEGDGRPDRT
jgi:hypothetical protein